MSVMSVLCCKRGKRIVTPLPNKWLRMLEKEQVVCVTHSNTHKNQHAHLHISIYTKTKKIIQACAHAHTHTHTHTLMSYLCLFEKFESWDCFSCGEMHDRERMVMKVQVMKVQVLGNNVWLRWTWETLLRQHPRQCLETHSVPASTRSQKDTNLTLCEVFFGYKHVIICTLIGNAKWVWTHSERYKPHVKDVKCPLVINMY